MIPLLSKIRRTLRSYIAFIVILFILSGCKRAAINSVAAFPQQFKAQIAFQRDNKGIIIPTHWGSTKKEYQLYLDNHSPTWVNDNIIHGNTSISKSKDFLYSTTTADGTVIQGDVYICDNIDLGPVSFKDVPFYNISNKTNEGKTDGAIGENIMTGRIWKIDFIDQLLTIASSIDSIKDLQQADILPAVFTEKAIEIEVRFPNNIKKKIELDLGYNGCITMPYSEFTSVTAHNKKIYTETGRLSTPAGSSIVKKMTVLDSIQVGGKSFFTAISSNQLVKEKLIGLQFFCQFYYIVIDYIHKAVYLSKNVRYQSAI